MKLTLHSLLLPLAHPFTISRGTLTEQQSLVVELSGDGISGWGEVTPNRFYHRSLENLRQSIESAHPFLNRYATEPPEDVWMEAMQRLEDPFAVSALDIAAHDWYARREGVQIWQRWGLNWQKVPQSSYTIAIDTIDRMVQKLEERPDWTIYKIKLGTGDDLEIVRRIRSATSARLRVDANCAWSVEQAIENSVALQELGVEFIEQPLPADADIDQHRQVFSRSCLPIIADESCQVESDVVKCQGCFHGINVKISKCGGLTPAIRMLRLAKQLGMKTMVGCMVESSIGISAAAQLLPLLDYADLDGSTLLREDPTVGVKLHQGTVQLTGQPGHGASLPTNR
jgi:L-Ala-D/L-Glu epimerase